MTSRPVPITGIDPDEERRPILEIVDVRERLRRQVPPDGYPAAGWKQGPRTCDRTEAGVVPG